MQKNCFVSLLVFGCLMASVAVQAAPVQSQVSLKDDFSGNTLSSLWTAYTGGSVTATVHGGALVVSGPYLGGQTGGTILSTSSVPVKSFRATVDVLEPGASTALGTYATLAITSNNGNILDLQHYAGSYRFAYGPMYSWGSFNIPEFGDEATTWHSYKITYDANLKQASAYVDEILVGTASVDMGSTVTYGFDVHASTDGAPLNCYFDDFIYRYNK